MDDGFELVWDTRCTVAESPVWDAAAGALWFVDIAAGRLHRYEAATGVRRSFDLPEATPSLGLCRSGRLVVALRRRVVLFDPRDGAIVDLAGPVDEPATSRLNDGKVGPDGCFWVGGMDERPEREKGPVAALYRVTPEGRMERKLDGLTISNGLAWSPDGRTMFHSDSGQRWIEAWDFDPATGSLSHRRRLATFAEGEGLPDGGATDAEGGYWSALVSAGRVQRFSPTGERLAWLAFPGPTPNMPCFAGDALYVTSLREGQSPETLARRPGLGGLFRTRAPLAGAPVGLFAD